MRRRNLITIMTVAVLAGGFAMLMTGCKERIRHDRHEPEPRPRSGWSEISGRLLVDGKPCDHGKVTVFWGRGREYNQTCKADKKGYFSMGNIPPSREIVVEFRGKRHDREYVATRSLYSGRNGEVVQLDIVDINDRRPGPHPEPVPGPRPAPGPSPRPAPRPAPLPTWSKITGRMFVGGKECKDGRVTVFWGKGRTYKQTVKVDKKGYFTVDNIPAKREVAVELRGKHKKKEYVTTRTLYSGRSGEILRLGDIDVAAPTPHPRPMPGPHPGPRPGPIEKCDLKVSGRVTYEGKPLENVTIRVMSGSIYDRFVKTDRKGRFHVTDVPRRAKVDVFAELKIHKGKLVGSSVIHTGKDDVNVGEIVLFKKKK